MRTASTTGRDRGQAAAHWPAGRSARWLLLAFWLAVPGAAFATSPCDVVSLSEEERIADTGARFRLDADCLVTLKEAGVSESVIQAFLDAAPYPRGFYSSHYYVLWLSSPWIHHDYFLDFHFGGHFRVAHYAGIRHSGHGFVAGHDSGDLYHAWTHAGAVHGSGLHTRPGASAVDHDSGAQHATASHGRSHVGRSHVGRSHVGGHSGGHGH